MNFADYLPDLHPSLGASIAKNVYSVADGFMPLPSPQAYGASLPAKFLGGTVVRSSAGVVYNFAGTAGTLRVLSGYTWGDATRESGGAYTATRWEFQQWLNTVIAVNRADVPQVITLGGARFSALGGSPPKAACICVLSDDFVMLGNLIEGGTTNHHSVHWSAYRNPANWTPDTETQCDRRDLEATDGPIHQLIGQSRTGGRQAGESESGLVFQEKAVSRITPIGAPFVFRFDKISAGIGSIAPGAVVAYGQDAYFIGQDGFAVIRGRSEYERIGTNAVDRMFFNDVRQDHLDKIKVGVWSEKGLIIWSYPGAGSSNGIPNRQLIYSTLTGKWSESDYPIVGFQYAARPAVMSDGLDARLSDNLIELVDSSAWAGGTANFGAFLSDNDLYFFTGNPGTAYVETVEVRRNPGRKTYVKKGYADLTDGVPRISVGTRNKFMDTPLWTPYRALNSYGEWDLHTYAEMQKFRVEVTGARGLIRGVDLIEVPGDAR